MSKVVPGVVAAAVLVVVLLVPAQSGAAKARCPEEVHDAFDLSPTGAVTVDGFVVQRSSNGRYQTDAGFDFDVNLGSVVAVDPMNSECNNVVKTVTLKVVNPFTGVTAVVEAVAP